MRRRPTVIVFARAPMLGAAKTRLARDVGRIAAWRFHRLNLAATLQQLGNDRRWRLALAVTPDRLARRVGPAAGVVERFGQGSGDLGRRMARALARFQPGPVLLVGCDIPGLRPWHLAEALRRLAAAEVIFGPAEDGGYWLVGVRGRRRPERLFKKVRWSSPAALSDSLSRRAPGERLALAATLADVDTGADLARAGWPAPSYSAAGASCSRNRGSSSAKLQGL